MVWSGPRLDADGEGNEATQGVAQEPEDMDPLVSAWLETVASIAIAIARRESAKLEE